MVLSEPELEEVLAQITRGYFFSRLTKLSADRKTAHYRHKPDL